MGLHLPMVILSCFMIELFASLPPVYFFFRQILLGIPSVSNSFDPDQARCYVGPDLVSNCLQKLSADDTRRQTVNIIL